MRLSVPLNKEKENTNLRKITNRINTKNEYKGKYENMSNNIQYKSTKRIHTAKKLHHCKKQRNKL